MNGTYIDISVSLREDLPVWPGDPAVGLPPAARTAKGDPVNVTGIRIGTHTGTHIDAEWHFIEEGGRLDDIAMERLIGPCTVVDLSWATSSLTVSDFERAGIPSGATRVLLKTKNSELWRTSPTEFSHDYIGITPDGARWLVEHHVDFVGIDYLSVEPPDADGDTHRIMLGAGQIILETIDLTHVDPGDYTLYCLPLRIDGADGAPSRVVLGPA
jgi:arylformamidase